MISPNYYCNILFSGQHRNHHCGLPQWVAVFLHNYGTFSKIITQEGVIDKEIHV